MHFINRTTEANASRTRGARQLNVNSINKPGKLAVSSGVLVGDPVNGNAWQEY